MRSSLCKLSLHVQGLCILVQPMPVPVTLWNLAGFPMSKPRMPTDSQVGEDGGGWDSGGCGGLGRIRPVRQRGCAPRPTRPSQTEGDFPNLATCSLGISPLSRPEGRVQYHSHLLRRRKILPQIQQKPHRGESLVCWVWVWGWLERRRRKMVEEWPIPSHPIPYLTLFRGGLPSPWGPQIVAILLGALGPIHPCSAMHERCRITPSERAWPALDLGLDQSGLLPLEVSLKF